MRGKKEDGVPLLISQVKRGCYKCNLFSMMWCPFDSVLYEASSMCWKRIDVQKSKSFVAKPTMFAYIYHISLVSFERIALDETNSFFPNQGYFYIYISSKMDKID